MEPAAASRLLGLVKGLGADAVAFQGLGAGMQVWFDDGPDGSGGAVAYFATRGAWTAAGAPVVDVAARRLVAERFVQAATAVGKRASFFGVESLTGFEAWPKLQLGEQPSGTPEAWVSVVKTTRALKEQLRRARAKTVHACVIPAADLAANAPLRVGVDRLLARWIAWRRIEPMAFLVHPDPYALPEEHVYVVARRGTRDGGGPVVGLLSAVPAYANHGFLVEHLVAARDSPNGTAETLLDALYRSLIAQGRGDVRVTLGLAPLAGDAGLWQRVARWLARPLFDFDGLRRFKARLRPSEWSPVWLVVPPGQLRVVALFDALNAFAGGSIVRFGVRSVLLRPRGLLWALAIGLVPWTVLLAWLDLTREQGVAGYSRGVLGAWIAFDVVLAAALFRGALRPDYRWLVFLVVAALADGVLSALHLHHVGLGGTLPDSALRLTASLAPFIGAGTLAYVTWQRVRQVARSGEVG